jgi:hypothetical protein
MTERSREGVAFIETIDKTAPQAVSACDGWTTHEIAAHVTGIAVEVIRHLDPYLHGDPVPETRSFEEREAPLQATEHALHRWDIAGDDEVSGELLGDMDLVDHSVGYRVPGCRRATMTAWRTASPPPIRLPTTPGSACLTGGPMFSSTC